MPLYTKPGDAWQEPEHIRSRQPDGTMQEVEVVRAKVGSEYVDVWPEYEQAIHYLMLYDYGDECTEVTGGWEYIQEIGYHHPSRIGIEIWHTKQKIDFSNYPKGMANRYSHFISGTSTSRNVYIFSEGAYKEPDGRSNYKGFVMFGTKSPNSLAPYIKMYTNTYYDTVNRGEKRSDCLYLYQKYDSYFELEEYVYSLCVFQSDDWQTWLSKAGLSATSLEAVMSDSTALSTLLSSWPATYYMLRQCTGDVMASAIQSAAFKAALATSPYKDKIYANPHWSKFLAMV